MNVDTGVMRIFGEWTPPPGMAEKLAAEAQAAIQRAQLGIDDAVSETEGTSDGESVRATVTAIRAAFAIT